MTDEELIARLRDFKKVTVWDVRDAADRIEQLVATNEALTKERDSLLAGHRVLNIGGARLQDRAETAEAKLAKAVEALERAKASIEGGGGGGVTDVVWLDDPCPETLCDFIDATLAEIKGAEHE